MKKKFSYDSETNKLYQITMKGKLKEYKEIPSIMQLEDILNQIHLQNLGH